MPRFVEWPGTQRVVSDKGNDDNKRALAHLDGGRGRKRAAGGT